MSKKEIPEEIEVTVGSGNAFADSGHPNPEEAMAKAELAMLITATIKGKKLTQKKAAALMGVDQPKISDIIRGKLSGFTIERLFRFLRALGIGIAIEPQVCDEKHTPSLTVLPCVEQPVKQHKRLRAC